MLVAGLVGCVFCAHRNVTHVHHITNTHAHYNNNQTLSIIENAEKHFHEAVYFDYDPGEKLQMWRRKQEDVRCLKNSCQAPTDTPHSISKMHTHPRIKRERYTHSEWKREWIEDWPNSSNGKCNKCWNRITKWFFISDKDSLFNQIDFKWKQLDDDAILACLPASITKYVLYRHTSAHDA